MARKKPEVFAAYLQKSYPKTIFSIRHDGGKYSEEDYSRLKRIFNGVRLTFNQLIAEKISTLNQTKEKVRFESKKLYFQIDEETELIEIRIVSAISSDYESAAIIFKADFTGHVFIDCKDEIQRLGAEVIFSIAELVANGGLSQYDADNLIRGSIIEI